MKSRLNESSRLTRRPTGAGLIGCAVLLLALCGSLWAQELPRIVAIEFEGLEKIPAYTVESVLTLKVGEVYSQEKAQQNVDAVDELGFFASVQLQILPVEGGITLKFMLAENPVLEQVRFDGNTAIPSEELMGQLISNSPGRVFNSLRVQRDEEAVLDYYRERGYVADVFSEVDLERGILTFRILEYRIEQITVEGNTKTKDHNILRWLYTRPGDLYRPRQFSERDLRELMNLGIFEDVPQVGVDLGSEPGQVALTLNVKERRTGLINGGAGFSSRYGLVGFVELGDTNFLGRTEQVNARVELGGRQSFELFYFDPWLDSKRTTLRVSLYDTAFDRYNSAVSGVSLGGQTITSSPSLNEERRGGELTIGRPLGINNRAQMGLKLETVNTERISSDQVPTLPGFPFVQLDDDTTHSLIFSVIRDTRDLFLDPSRGTRLSVDVELAGSFLGGNNDFGKYILEGRKYLRFSSRDVLAGRLMAGLSSGDVPYSQAYFLGGTDNLRGYEEDQFIGDRMLLMNVEWRRRLTRNLQAAAFVDSGRAWRSAESVSLSDLVVGYGLGMRVTTPLGPLRVDYALGKEGSQFHFGFAQVF